MTKQNRCHDELLTLYHYDELTEDQRRELELHLESCPPCRTALAGIEESLAALPAFELKLTAVQKRHFVEKVTQPIRRRSIRSIRTIGSWGGGLAAAGMLAVVILMLQPANQHSLVAPVVPTTEAMADFELLEQLELLQDLDLLQELELLQALETLG